MAKLGMDGREYKLLLRGERLPAEPVAEAGQVFFAAALAPAISQLASRESGASRLEGRVTKVSQRTIRFWDLNDGFLAQNLYSLRERLKLKRQDDAAEEGKLTLKLRTPDLFVALGTSLTGITPKSKVKLEEDIAPLAVESETALARPRKPSTHSRFSRSLTQNLPVPLTWGGLSALCPELDGNLAASGALLPAEARRLIAGPTIEETTWTGPEIALGEGMDAAITLTRWQLADEAVVPVVGELSFACDLDGQAMPLAAALRAHRLFTGLQTALGELIETRFASKTAMALPVRIGAP